jgi:hypothetical protein
MAAIASTDGPILLILAGDECGNAIAAACDYAKSTSRPLRTLQILTSDLYHYGHHDLVATRPSKKQFLLYIREEVMERGKEAAQALERKAAEMGIYLEIIALESEDLFSTSLEEARKGYDIIFLPKQKKKLFPLFKKTLAAYLEKKIAGRIVSC